MSTIRWVPKTRQNKANQKKKEKGKRQKERSKKEIENHIPCYIVEKNNYENIYYRPHRITLDSKGGGERGDSELSLLKNSNKME